MLMTTKICNKAQPAWVTFQFQVRAHALLVAGSMPSGGEKGRAGGN